MHNTSGLWRGGSTGGPPGSLNRVTDEVGTFCQRLSTDAGYRAAFEERLHAGTLAPQLEAMIWSYAIGKPQQTLEVTSGPSVSLNSLQSDFLTRTTTIRTATRVV
jgi:hypothetical protein